MIKIVGLGPGAKEALTIGTVWELESCKNIFLRTEKHPTVDYLKEKNIEFDTYDNVYEINNKLDETNEALEVILDKGNPPLEGLFDIHEGIERARKGGTLTPGQLLKIGSTLRAARNMKEFFKREEFEKSYERLEDFMSVVNDLQNYDSDHAEWP